MIAEKELYFALAHFKPELFYSLFPLFGRMDPSICYQYEGFLIYLCGSSIVYTSFVVIPALSFPVIKCLRVSINWRILFGYFFNFGQNTEKQLGFRMLSPLTILRMHKYYFSISFTTHYSQ